MIELHIHMEPLDDKEKQFVALYKSEYVPGISIQKGFRRTTLLKKRDAPREYQIDIAFDTEERRLQWVASREHEATWPKLSALCRSFSCVGFDTVA